MPQITLGPQAWIVYDSVRERIVSGTIAPGAQLPSQKELARQYGVAPMTARQALMRLADEGLVATKTGRGTYVSPAAIGEAALSDSVVIPDDRQRSESDLIEVLREERQASETAADRLARMNTTSIPFGNTGQDGSLRGIPSSGGERQRYKDGHRIELLEAPASDASGVVSTRVGRSEQRQAGDALAASEQCYRSVAEASVDGILIIDLGGTIIFANQHMAGLLALSSLEELSGRRVCDLITEADHQSACVMETLLKQGSVSGLRFALIRSDGTSFPCELSASLVLRADGTASGAAVVVRDMTERQAYEEQLRHQALYDPLTNLPNRTLFNDRLAQVLLMARREGEPFALLLANLDCFEEVNDTLGHETGDAVVQQVAGRLRDALRESDTVARLDGDEFAIILPDADEHGAIQVINALLNDFVEPIVVGPHQYHPEFSIGGALFPQHAEDVAMLLRRADAAMYTAKQSGGSYALYEVETDRNSERQLALMTGLRRAIDEGQLVLHYQPKVDLETGQATRVEALVRWNHPQFGCIPPDQFISLAEHTGLIRPMSRWVLNEALRQIAGWHTMGHDIAVAVNLSTCNLQEADLVDGVTKLLATWDIPASSLGIEITESTLMADPDHAMATLTALHDMGIIISIDDFGTGYSSLAYLQRLPANEVKIDRAFVSGMSTPNSGSSSIVRSIVDLGHILDLRVVAEGIERQQDLDILGAMGCDVAQGYYLGKPMPGNEYLAWLDDWEQRGWFLPSGAAAS